MALPSVKAVDCRATAAVVATATCNTNVQQQLATPVGKGNGNVRGVNTESRTHHMTGRRSDYGCGMSGVKGAGDGEGVTWVTPLISCSNGVSTREATGDSTSCSLNQQHHQLGSLRQQ